MTTLLGRIFAPLGLLVFVIGLRPGLAAPMNNPVVIEATITPKKDSTTHFTITVKLKIQDGWHTYDEVPEGNASPSTVLSLELPEGIKVLGDWSRPVGQPYPKDPTLTVFKGTVQFTREIEADQNKDSREIGLQVRYQVCNEQLCFPPTVDKTKITLVGTADPNNYNVVVEETDELSSFTNQHFDAPVRLTVDGAPLNEAARQMYPSPAMYDVDNDGKIELVVGDIFGSLYVYENQNDTGKGDPKWSSHTPLKMVGGKQIKVSNW